ncbi:MAG: peptidylprolyl isomerase [Pirellulales bacterium]|nr:peptidylprolyl isomerase [Pirellulales bacterium]
MMRAVYPFALSLTLVLLATMWLRPGLAQELIEMANRVRAQSPDRSRSSPLANTGTAPPNDPLSQIPYDSISRPPMQPVPVARPIAWPGSSPPPGMTAQPQATAPANASSQLGVTTWEPPTERHAPAATNRPQYVAQVPPSSALPIPQSPITQPASAGIGVATAPMIANSAPVQSLANVNSSAASPPLGTVPAAPNFETKNLQVWPGPPKDIPDAQIAAKIGSEVILVGDMKAVISNTIHNNKLTIAPEQREAAFRQAYRPILKQLIETKLIYNDALHTIPKEALPKIEADINSGFDKAIVPNLLESYGAVNPQDLDRKMRDSGSSLDFMRRYFFETTMANQWKLSKIKTKEEVPHSEVLGYYKSHLSEYEFPAKARWEELMVWFDRFPDKSAAYAAICHLGIAVQQGQPFAEVARANSQGLTASDGGQWDWTAKGALATKPIDQAIFGLPVGRLSQVIETDRGFHIVRVVERTEAGRRQFIDIQNDIKKQIKEQRDQKQKDDYMNDLRARTKVWTMFDHEPGGLDGPKQEKRSIFE